MELQLNIGDVIVNPKDVFFPHLSGRGRLSDSRLAAQNDFLICFSIVYLMSSFIRYSDGISITPVVKLH